MNHKNYYVIYTDDIPNISQEDLVPGTILVGTREKFGIRCFPWKARNNTVRLFNSNVDTATIIGVRSKKNIALWSSSYYADDDLILLNNTQKILFVVSSRSKLFVKLGPP